MKMGEQTNVTGLYRDGKAWTIRAAARTSEGVKIEKRKRLENVSQGEALLALEKLREELGAEVGPSQSKAPTLTAYAQLWLKSMKAKRQGKTKQASFDTRVAFLTRFVLPFAGHREPKSITGSLLEDWKVWLAEQRQPALIGKRKNPRAGLPYAHETLLSAWGTMRSLLAYAAIKEGIPNPISDLRFDVEGVEKVPKAALTQDELARLIEAAVHESADIRAMLILGLATGMRFCELSALTWEDIDFGGGFLRITKSQVKGQVGPPKTEASRRIVYLAPEVVHELERHRQWQEAEDCDLLIPGLVFPSRRGGYRMPQMLNKPLAACAKAAGISKHLTSHCMRKTANNLIRQEAGAVVARAMVGHTTEQMTQLYSEVDKKERLEAVKGAFGDWLGGTESRQVKAVPPN